MSINVYLKKELQEMPGFRREPSKKDPKEEVLYFNRTRVNLSSSGRIYIYFPSPSSLPEGLENFIEEISLREELSTSNADRETGMYKNGTARAELEKKDGRFLIKMTAKTMEDIVKLLFQIKAGTIRPEISYEGEQGGKSSLEKKYRDLEVEMEDMKTAFEQEKRQVQMLKFQIARFEEFSNSLAKEKWPFCNKLNVSMKLNQILLEGYKTH